MNAVALSGKISGHPKSAMGPDGRLLLVQFRLVDTGLLMDVVVPGYVAEPILHWLSNGQRVVVQGTLAVVFFTERATGIKHARTRIKATEVLRIHEESNDPPKGGVVVKGKEPFHLAASSSL